ncbi:hypothetical protein HY797_04395 [Candidatus Falkowbacteria bacterium]|nr:hypothetical protein [Candidatus Falkowbacteria bacterium]
MKTRIFAVTALALVLLVGCAGQRHAVLKINKNDGSIIHDDQNFSMLQPSIGPLEMSNAKAIIIAAEAQADLTRALTKQIERGQQAATTNGHYVGIIINDDPKLAAYIPHPEINQRIKISPSSYAMIFTNNIADKIIIYGSNGDYTISRTFNGGVYNGIKYDYGVRIYRVR